MARVLAAELRHAVAKLMATLEQDQDEVRAVLGVWDRFQEHPQPGTPEHRLIYDALRRALEQLRVGSELSARALAELEWMLE